MSTSVAESDTCHRLASALVQVRKARHQPNCICGGYRDHTGAPYCTDSEYRWSEMVNRILTTIQRES